MKKLSIITINYNNGNKLVRTFESLLNQTFDNFEYIIIDGGSTDNSINIFKKYENKFHNFKWISESDNGISSAFNKGITEASGDIVGTINSGDAYAKDLLEIVVSHFASQNIDILYGDTLIINDRGQKIKYVTAEDWNQKFKGTPFMHSSVFLTKELYSKIGFFNESYKYAMDIDLLYRAFQETEKVLFVNKLFSYQEVGGLSHKNRFKALKEYEQISLLRDLHPKNKIRLYFFYRKLRVFLKSIGLVDLVRTLIDFIFQNVRGIYLYLVNHIINKIPLKTLRILFYKLVSPKLKIAKNSNILANCTFLNPRNIKIGKNSRINEKCKLDGRGANIEIGENVDIGAESIIWTLTHDPDDLFHSTKSSAVIIEDYAWIGARTIILPGIRIGKGAVIGTGSIVTNDIPPSAIYAGNPAKFIKNRNNPLIYNLITKTYWK